MARWGCSPPALGGAHEQKMTFNLRSFALTIKMAPRPEIAEVPQSSPDGESSFIAALQGGPQGSPGVPVPTRLFTTTTTTAPPEPQGYMEEEEAVEGKILVLRHVQEEAEEVGDTDSVCSAVECEDIKAAMDSAFWDRVYRSRDCRCGPRRNLQYHEGT
jgi:hypothetical protein